MGYATRLHQATQLQLAARARSVGTTNPKPAPTAAFSPMIRLQQSIGNRAVGRLVQAKLKVGRPGNEAEREADRVADQVMRAGSERTEPQLQRTCACGGQCPTCQAEQAGREHAGLQARRVRSGDHIEPKADRGGAPVMQVPDMTVGTPPRIQRRCSECEEALQRKRASGAEVVGSGFQHPRGGGRPLPDSDRGFFEPRFGQELSRVRIHTDSEAGKAARWVGALAYTLGSDIVLGEGQYRPGTEGGRRLLAHELTHVIQQNAAGTPSLQRREIASQAPAGLLCAVATSTPASIDTEVLFSLGSSTLTRIAIADIASFATRWNAAGADKFVRVDGYASVYEGETQLLPGNPVAVWSLSCDRAMAIEGELMTPSSGARGIPADFIDVFARGETSEGTSEPPHTRATISADIPARPLAPSRPGCRSCPFFCGYDGSKDRYRYNCAGLAFRTYVWHDMSEAKGALAQGSKVSCGTPCAQVGMIKFWSWEYDSYLEDSSGRVLRRFDPDFHMVGGPTAGDPLPKDSDAFYSKNNKRPVEGPGIAPRFRPAAREQEIDEDNQPVFDERGNPRYWVRFNLKESCYCFPCPKNLEGAKW